MLKITSKSNNQIVRLKKLIENKKYRQKEQQFIVEGYHLVQEAKNSGLLLSTYESNPEKIKYDDSILITKELMKYLCDTITPQDIIGVCKFPNNNQIGSKVLFLDELQDPGNVGTIIRLAQAFDIDTVIINKFDYFNPKTIRSSQGAFFKTDIIGTKDGFNLLSKIKNNGYKIYATVLNEKAKELNHVVFNEEKFVLVVGNEGNGITSEIQSISDEFIYIPISFESLNVACATAIVLNKIRNEN
ncbi:TrmH family RNA methyltransferase [Mycoplasmopsis verecunda]|uniref:RNA methyltransferase, TrmH family n=1 Tax=Mycoplasmopsis verecunda TaxID=171291 RepID=A0A1T4KN05_9BACT|nr:RNA methyltransferase [Mycoplasmopsis verecunda]WPB54303.1 RNA methyltransferase [Mycoplasmopsis verecunda]SJZ43748.1 RNA methyltransferase, TrmH family [Mycoplasmopsis verecunda]